MEIDGALEKTYKDHIHLFISIGRYKFSLDQATAMDRLQEAFVKIWSTRMRIKNQQEAGLRNYAIRVFRNTCIDHLRKKKLPSLFESTGNQQIKANLSPTMDTIASPAADPLNELLLIEEMRLQEAALDRLPSKYRDAVRLSLQGLKPREITSQLGIKQSTFKNLKHRGLKMFKRELEKTDPDRIHNG
jgi:RNA polymerase sigma factor (sigma-70 family)